MSLWRRRRGRAACFAPGRKRGFGFRPACLVLREMHQPDGQTASTTTADTLCPCDTHPNSFVPDHTHPVHLSPPPRALPQAAAILKAEVYGIPRPDWASDAAAVASAASKVVVPEFKPKQGVKIETDPKVGGGEVGGFFWLQLDERVILNVLLCCVWYIILDASNTAAAAAVLSATPAGPAPVRLRTPPPQQPGLMTTASSTA